MHNDKKLTKDDTWRSVDLRKYINEREGDERKHRRGESTERRHRDPNKESRRERDKQKESTRERRDEDERNRYADRRKEGSRDRRSDKERVRREERDGEKRERDKLLDEKMYDPDHKEERDRRRNSEGRHERDKERDRHRDKEKEEEKDRKRGHEGGDDKRREERDKERRREARDREHTAERERRRQKEGGEGDKDRTERHEREKRERHRERERCKDEYEDKRIDEETRERHEERKRLEMRKERDHKEEHRRHREEKERRHKERGYHRKHDSDSGGHRGLKGPGEEVRHHLGGRERVERNEYKERTPKAEVVPERNHHKESTKKSTSEKSHRHETKAEDIATVFAPEHQAVGAAARGNTEEAVVNDGEAYEEYEDDFEDYEEDFEEMDESAKESEEEKEPQHTDEDEEREEPKSQRRKEIEAIQRAMDEENERVGTTLPRQYRSREEEDAPKSSRESERNQSRSSQRGKFIDFVAAKRREVSKQAATKQKKRSEELLRLIDLDFSMTFSILDLPPVNEYDMYIRNFGAANTKQAYVQCNEDNADRDIQTEEIEMCEKWTQHPPECGGACGDPNLSQEARDKSASETNFDSQRLAAFLRSASQVMVVLFEEERAEKKSLRKMRSEAHTLSFSDGSLQLNTKLPFLYGRSISLVHFSQVQRYTMMTVHSPTAKPSAVRLDSCTIICIWNIWEPSRPQKVLTYESEVQCCCFSPGKATLVFAGTSVGSVLLWDLREQASIHYRLKIGQDEWIFRQPTFSTDAVMASSGHQSSVTSLEVVPSVAGGQELEAPLLASEEDSSGLSFQLASLDETGVLNFWVVVELPKPNESGSPTDLGLRPGGKVKLLHSSSLLAAERSPRNAKTLTLQSLHLKFLPTDSNHFFIGTNMGLVNHGTSHGLNAPLKFYRCREAGVRPVEVTSIHFSPFVPQLFLVGCVDGSIRLHAVSYEQPLAEWKNGAEVVSVQWSQTRATVFCVLDAASNLHIWDLSKSDTEPVITETVNPDRVTAMALFGDSGQHNTYSGVALAHESGTIDIQYFSKHLASPSATDVEKLEIMMTEAF